MTKGHPVFARPRRLAPDKLVTAEREFDDMIKLGVIEPSDSEWSSALHMVPKKMETGDRAEIIADEMFRQYRIDTRFHTYKTLPKV